MKRWWSIIAVAALAGAVATGTAFARKHHSVDANGNSASLVTVNTAAGIPITVSRTFEPKITAFISDLVARGYRPKSIRCLAHGGHIRGSRHYSGNACDFDQRAFGRTAGPMYHVAGLAAAHGLRDGGSFRDWGHIDDGAPLRRDYTPQPTLVAQGYTTMSARRHQVRMAAHQFVPPDRLTAH